MPKIRSPRTGGHEQDACKAENALPQLDAMSDETPPSTSNGIAEDAPAQDASAQRAPDTIFPGLPLDELVAALARSALFRDVEPAQLRLLAFSAEVRDITAGETVCDAGALGAPAFLVSGGRLFLGEDVVGPGALINAHGAMADTVMPAVLSAKKNSRLLIIDRPLVARLIGEYPAMGRAMMRSLGMDLRGLARGIRAQTRAAMAKRPSSEARP